MAVTVKVCFFAAAREQVGVDELPLELADGACTTSAAAKLLQMRYPQLEKLLPRCALAVNGEYVQSDTALKQGDELAVLPPMSGG